MSDELPPEPPAPAPTLPDAADFSGPDPVKSERGKRAAETRAKKKKAKEERQRRAIEKRAALKAARDEELEEKRAAEEEARAAPAADKPPASVDAELAGAGVDAGGDEAWERWVRDEMERPLNGPEDLAELLGKIQMTCIGAAQGTAFEEAAWSLQWTNGKDPLRRARIGSRCLWPWMKKNGYDGVKLAEQSEGVLALIGVLVLVGPSLRPTVDALQKFRRDRELASNATQQQQETPPAAA